MTKKLSSTPCINICKINSEDGFCLGCFRTLNEIAQWAQLNDAEKERIFEAINEIKKYKPEISCEVKT